MSFEPIAIVGQSCVLPGALNPGELWNKIAAGKNLLSKVPEGYWRTSPNLVMAPSEKNARDITWCDQGGYVSGFESVFHAGGFSIPEEEVMHYGRLVHWLLHTAREALNDAGYQNAKGMNAGVVFGNLSYPSPSMSEFAESIWLDVQSRDFFKGKARQLANVKKPHAINRFMSGFPAHIVARALDLNNGAFAIDAACASSLFAMKLACDKLHDRTADLMLAGGVQGSDDLIIHIGFCTLQAMSQTGQSRPFHKNADGLVPAEGCGFITLKRLEDAVSAGDKIHGVIRGIGLSNDGKGHGLLVPSADGQFRAMQKAYQVSGIDPAQISLLECHATGTTVGDGIELESSNRIFKNLKELPIGTIKSNMGHPITASGIAGLLKVTGAMKAGIRPPTLHVDDPTDKLLNTPFRLIKKSEPWPSDDPRIAGISNFGFGGNNAHLIIEEFDAGSYKKPPKAKPSGKSQDKPKENIDIAIVGMGAMVASGTGIKDFTQTIFAGKPALTKDDDGTMAGSAGPFELPLMGLRFFPAALDQTLPQQLLILKATMEALDEVDKFPNKRAGVFVGMGCDCEVTRSGMCWRLPQFACDWLQASELTPEMKDWIEFVKDDQINPAREASAILGAMPNIVANRINSQFDIEGQSFTVASEELSGIRCLELAVRALMAGEIDAAVVGAVDISCETVHTAAVKEILDDHRQIPGDAAISLVLKRAKDARTDGDKIYALLSNGVDKDPDQKPTLALSLDEIGQNITPLVGHSHAASGLLHVATAALACRYRALPAGIEKKAIPWLSSHVRSAKVTINALGGESSTILVKEDKKTDSGHLLTDSVPRLHIYSGKDQTEILNNLDKGIESDIGPARLILVAKESAHFLELSQQAKSLLEKEKNTKNITLGNGIYYCSQPLEGELAFLFSGPAGAYPQMGRDLLLAMPELIEEVISRLGLDAKDIERWMLDVDNEKIQTPEVMLWRSSFLSQIHAVLTQNYLGLQPQAAIGFSSGESNSLFAMGAWQDMGQMAADFEKKGVYAHEIGGDFNVVKNAWKIKGKNNVAWTNYGILAPEDTVRKEIESEPLAHLIIINAPGNCVIGGDKSACQRVIDKIGRHHAYPLDYNIANHCPEIASYADEWRDLHTRCTKDVSGVRFYSSSTCSHYHPTTETSAQAILDMATNILDFPSMIENAYNDGVRIFLEHGPRGLCSQWIGQILKDKEHIAVSIDKRDRSSLDNVFHAMAQLKAAGVDVNYKGLENLTLPLDNNISSRHPDKGKPIPTRVYKAHPSQIILPEISSTKAENTVLEAVSKNLTENLADTPDKKNPAAPEKKQVMAKAPGLPSAVEGFDVPKVVVAIAKHTTNTTSARNNELSEQSEVLIEKVQESSPDSLPEASKDTIQMDHATNNILEHIAAQNEKVSKIHQEFLAQQATVHKNFLDHRQNVLTTLGRLSGQEISSSANVNLTPSLSSQSINSSPDAPPVNREKQIKPTGQTSPLATSAQHPNSVGIVAPVAPASPVKPSEPIKEQLSQDINIASAKKKSPTALSIQSQKPAAPFDPAKDQFANAEYIEPSGPKFSKEQLEILASGKISDVFGEMFKIQDDYPRQVRLPEYPLLLADRITGLKAEPGQMGKGIIWTETDVVAGAWYLNDIYMPAGVTVESGQCDLTLVSYLGADFQNKGKRVYRLLGCDLMYYGEPPRVGDTLCYQIHVDGHANIGETRIFFFRYDCRINGELRLSVRNAQAGFFSDEELAASGGILWTPETGEYKPDEEAVVDPPVAECTQREFSMGKVRAFSEGRVFECFGPGFELAQTHSKTPKIQSGKMLLLDQITRLEPTGGPWGRGYLKAENIIPSDAWYLTCHFKNDPCMPGTLMSDACLQALAFYMTAMGHTLKRDGWRFDPVPDEVYHIKCRGQVTPNSENLSYELFVEEIIDGPCPTIYGDILGTCDGLKILHIRRMGLRLVPDYPLDCWPHLLENHVEEHPVAKIGDMEFGYKSMLACAFGKPSEAFGNLGKPFDGPRHIARLPGPPYHFMSRVSSINATMGGMKTNETIEVDYDITENEWYFDKNGNRTMPFCVLMEVALQPCGWLAVFEGGPATSDKPLYFRNMDGTGTITDEILPHAGTIRTRTTLTKIINFSGIILVNFDVECFIKDKCVYKMETGFGFFHKEALDHQKGLPATDEERKWLDEPSDFLLDLTERPAKYCDKAPRLPKSMLLMIDRVTGFWPADGKKGLGRLRAEKTVDISEWFFKAHFFHDPVQPGSLGVEAMVQTLQFYMIHKDMHKGIANPWFQPIGLDRPVTWKYRGQVTPSIKRISIEMEITDQGHDERGSFAVAEAWLWADDLKIFHVKDLCMYIVEAEPDTYVRLEDNRDAEDDADIEVPQDLKKIDLKKTDIKTKDQIIKDVAKEIEKKTYLTHVNPAYIQISKDKKTAFCDFMPLSSFPIKIQKQKSKNPIIKLDEPALDYDKIFDYGRNLFNIGPWLFENITRALWERFVRYVIIEDPIAFEKLRHRSLLYLGNHQIQVESMLFPLLAQVLTQRRIVTIANADHRTGWIGALNDIVYSYPGINYPKNIIYFDQNDRKSLFTIIDQFKEQITNQGISVFLHTEGRLGLTCRNPVKVLSSVFIDMALESDLPIVPVRFIGGLPVEKFDHTLDFPVGYGKQDYYIGAPILPETLKALNYADRRKMVINAINNLGGSNAQETPNASDPHFIEAVKSWRKKTGATEVKAVLFKALDMLTELPEKETHKVLLRHGHGETINFMDNDKDRWLKKISDWLFE